MTAQEIREQVIGILTRRFSGSKIKVVVSEDDLYCWFHVSKNLVYTDLNSFYVMPAIKSLENRANTLRLQPVTCHVSVTDNEEKNMIEVEIKFHCVKISA